MRVRRGDGEALRVEPSLPLQALRHILSNGLGNAEVVGGDDDDRILAAANRECLGEDMLAHALGLGAAKPEAVQPNRVRGRHVHGGDADGISTGICRDRNRREGNNTD
jgi:hypothetical protein